MKTVKKSLSNGVFHGLRYEIRGPKSARKIKLDCGLSDVIAIAEKCKDIKLGIRANQEGLIGFITSSKSDYSESKGNSDKFCGGNYRDLMDGFNGKIDMHPFFEKRDEFAKGDVAKKLQAVLREVSPKRKRFMSEHDGDWNYDRRWEITPFSNTVKALSPGKTVDLLCDFAVNSMTTASELNQYGAMVWAISDLIETSGIPTNITTRFLINGIDDDRELDMELSIQIKKAGEYMAPTLLASVFRSIFFRRAIFGVIVIASELDKREHCGSLGRPVQQGHRIKFEEGLLQVSPSVTGATDLAIEQEILKALQSGTNAAVA